MKARTLLLAFVLAACGPPLPRSSDGGVDRDGGKDGEAPDAQATDDPPVTSGTMSATLGGGAKFSATSVGARRVAGGRL